jgi:hypothetical protein
MGRAKQLPTSQRPAEAPDVARELCDLIEAATCTGEVRHALARAAAAALDGTIDERGMSSVTRLARRANKAMGAVTQRMQLMVKIKRVSDRATALQRRRDRFESIKLPRSQFKRLDDRDA